MTDKAMLDFLQRKVAFVMRYRAGENPKPGWYVYTDANREAAGVGPTLRKAVQRAMRVTPR